MEKKDLFDAIHNVDENFIANAWENTEADRPIVLRPEKRSAKKTVRNIMLGVGGTAAAAALGFAVIAGANGLSLKSIIAPASSTSESTGFDINTVLPVEIFGPDGVRLTYKDFIDGDFGECSLWKLDSTEEQIAKINELLEDFDNNISGIYDKNGVMYFDGFQLSGFVYLPEPGTGKLKRYNDGDTYGGVTIGHGIAMFDADRQYKWGSTFMDSSKEISAEIVIGENATSDNSMMGAPDDNYFLFTANGETLTNLMGGLTDGKANGVIGLYTDVPKNTPINAKFRVWGLSYHPEERPFVQYLTSLTDFEPFNDNLKQWLEKDLVPPTADVGDDFSFLSCGNAAKNIGSEIYAVDDGEVIDVNSSQVAIKHGEGLYTTYSYVDGILVNKGDRVKAGQVIGAVYSEGPAGPEMDYEFTQETPEILAVNTDTRITEKWLSEWTQKGLTLPTAEVPDDFDFLGHNSYPMEYGSDVFAVDDGIVVFAGYDEKLGNVICIKHGSLLFTTYTHLAEESGVIVNKSDKVTAGQVIGHVGESGTLADNSTHLDYTFSMEMFNGKIN